MSATPRRARWSVATVFATNGFLVGSWAPNVPLIRDRLALSDGALSLALLALAAGAVISMPVAGYLISRFGSAGPTRIAALLMTACLPLTALAPDLALLSAATFLFGAANGICDVAMNAHAVEVERQYGRPIMSSLHATWSVGGFLASSAAAILLLHMGTLAHFTAVAAIFLVIAGFAARGLLPGASDRGEAGSHFALPDRRLALIGLLMLICFLTEGAMLDWNAVFMRATYPSHLELGAAGYAAFAGGMALGRFSGDFVRLSVGAVPIVRWGGLAAAAGLLVAVFAGSVHVAIAGFALAGLGISNLVPLMFTAAGRANPASPGKGVAAAATCGYCGFLAGPPAIGFLSEHVGLSPAFVLLALACAAVAAMAAAVRPADRMATG